MNRMSAGRRSNGCSGHLIPATPKKPKSMRQRHQIACPGGGHAMALRPAAAYRAGAVARVCVSSPATLPDSPKKPRSARQLWQIACPSCRRRAGIVRRTSGATVRTCDGAAACGRVSRRGFCPAGLSRATRGDHVTRRASRPRRCPRTRRSRHTSPARRPPPQARMWATRRDRRRSRPRARRGVWSCAMPRRSRSL